MRILSTVATVAFLAASPLAAQVSMAQVVIKTPAPPEVVPHDMHTEHQERAAQRDEYKARRDAAMGNYHGAAHEHDKALDHRDAAQH